MIFFCPQAFLDRRNPAEVKDIVNSRTNGATPLIMSAKHGHLTCVDYLVENCHSDIELVGSGKAS